MRVGSAKTEAAFLTSETASQNLETPLLSAEIGPLAGNVKKKTKFILGCAAVIFVFCKFAVQNIK